MIPALIIGRKGSRVKDKNVRPLLGRPLALYPMLAAKHAAAIDRVFVSTDCDKIQAIADRLEADPTGYVLGKDQPKEYPAQ